jgi:IS1 family transposase/transposase-like protein
MKTILAFLLSSFMIVLSNVVREPVELPQEKCEEIPNRACPACGSRHLIKNGSVHNGKSKHQCKSCGRQFVINPTKITISKETKQLIDRLLLERISLRGIARVTQVSWSWLQDYVNQRLARTPRQIKVSEKSPHQLTIECDEIWSFVDSKKNELYIWLAIDRKSRKIVGCFVGDRTRKSARQLWASLPEVYQQYAVAYTDFWQAYKTVIPRERHRAVGKETGLTNHIERLNNTFRQRVSRLVRESLSFSKKLNNHIGAIWYFIHGYNAELERI